MVEPPENKNKHRIICYSKIHQNSTHNFQNILNNKLHHAQQLQQHEHIAHIEHQIQQIRLNKQTLSQIRSRLPPLTSIDNPSPLAPITENLTQTKSLLPSDTNITSPTPLIKQTQITNSPLSCPFLKIYETPHPTPLTLLNI